MPTYAERAAVAVAEVRSLGLEPLEDFPGTTKPWRCRCTVCGTEGSPRLGNIRSGQGPCRGCGNRVKSAKRMADGNQAAKFMREHGYEPLEPYPGTSEKWRCLHIACGREVEARHAKIKAGEGCCGPCGVAASAAARSVDPEEARAVMLVALLEPVLPYPGGNQMPWSCRCLICGASVSPTLGNISRGQGGCTDCGRRRAALARRGDAGQAEADMLAALLRPLEPYPGFNRAWLCECLRCGDQVRPRLSHIRQGRGGCAECGYLSNAAKQLGDPVQAAADMRADGYTPLEPYPGAGRGWLCRHEPCGNQVWARLSKIRNGEGCCSHCATYGFNTSAPAVVYVLHHPEHGAVKVGITADTSDRIERFVKHGWTHYHSARFETGEQARMVEQAVLRHLREERGLGQHLGAADTIGTGGSTETFDATELSVSELWTLVSRISSEKLAGPAR